MTRGRTALLLAGLAAALVVVPGTPGSGLPRLTGWLTYGNGPQRLGDAGVAQQGPQSLRTSWFLPVDGTETSQPLIVRGVPGAGDQTEYFGTTTGALYALAPNGYVRWKVELGQLNVDCDQLSEYGVTGTPVVDASTRSLYVADAFGRLHALDLATGRERPGWPVVLFPDYRRELVWGAMVVADGAAYVPTGSFCDRPMEGKLIRVDLRTRTVSSWTAVPFALGGGGGIWGWGGVAYAPGRDSLYVATGNAFAGGTNVGPGFMETAGYGEHLVELSPDLHVRASSTPPGLGGFEDVDFVGSPVVARSAGCGELVAAQAKNGTLYGWRADDVGAGPIWTIRLQAPDPQQPLLTQPAYSARTSSFYVVTFSKLLRVALDSGCTPRVAWSLPLGEPTLQGSPTVAGGRVWVALSGAPATLLAVDAAGGRVLARRSLGGISFAAPSVRDGRLYLGQMHGYSARPFPASRSTRVSAVPGYTSWADSLHGWRSRENGVYASDDGGRRWRRIFPGYAAWLARTSARAGVISVGNPAPACGCSTRRLWTDDVGRTWHATRAVGLDFAGRGRLLYWWDEHGVHQVEPWPPSSNASLRSRLVAAVDGRIVSAALVPGGIAVLVLRPGRAPQVVIWRGGKDLVETLPVTSADVQPRTLRSAWPRLFASGVDYSDPGAGPDPAVTWHSVDGGATWSLSR